jgi:hypothetical protein
MKFIAVKKKTRETYSLCGGERCRASRPWSAAAVSERSPVRFNSPASLIPRLAPTPYMPALRSWQPSRVVDVLRCGSWPTQSRHRAADHLGRRAGHLHAEENGSHHCPSWVSYTQSKRLSQRKKTHQLYLRHTTPSSCMVAC